jgi:phosphatidylglycerol:prolipoprotein diacylglycerol transferase
VDKIAFQIGGINIYWYGVCIAVGFLLGLWTATRRALRAGISGESVADLGLWLMMGAVVGSRLFYVISHWDTEFAGRPLLEVFKLREGGLVFYGGLIGASLACVFAVRLKKLPLWKTADVLAPSIALGYVFGRIGCFMFGCCYGKPCDLPWAVHFPRDHATYPQGVHPTQLYESLLSLVLYAGLAWLHRHKKFDGQVFAAYLIAYGSLRFTVEFFRGDYPMRYLGGWATPAQLFSLPILGAGLILWRYQATRSQAAGSARS